MRAARCPLDHDPSPCPAVLSILLIYAVLLVVLVLGISLVVALFRRRTYWRLWGGLTVAIPILLLASIEWARPIMDMGPFHGQPRADCPARAPDHSFVTRSGFRLETFDSTPRDPVATVRLRTRGGKTKWCIRAGGR